jgi:SagB-type dehydrogenase family enzyme
MLKWQDTYKLSRFAYLRIREEGFVLESALTNRQFAVSGPSVLRILDGLSKPRPLASLLASAEESMRPAVRAFIEACWQAKLLTRVHEDGSTEEERSSLLFWEFHDLLFHGASRLGRNRQPIGATYRLKSRVPGEQSRTTSSSLDHRLVLPRPQQDSDPQKESTLSRVLQERPSVYAPKPIDITALGHFLCWTFRITGRLIRDKDEVTINKVYPSTNGLDPLRIYLAVTSCDGCRPGLYLYLDDEHALTPIRDLDASVLRLLVDARDYADGLSTTPPLLLIIAARFQSTAWKYESIAYRLMLLEVGGLLQTMHLVATAMGLGSCALNTGDSDHFARTIGSDYYTETSMGEFLLGCQ